MASNTEKVSIWWRHHEYNTFQHIYVLTHSYDTSISVNEIWYILWDELVAYTYVKDGRLAKDGSNV